MTKVQDLMIKNIATVYEDDNIQHICRILTRKKLSGVPVVNKKGKCVGFISERDIIAAVPRPNFSKCKAKHVMMKKVVTIKAEEPIANVSKVFTARKFRALPVVKDGKVVGIITRKDAIEHMLGYYQ